MNEIAQIKAAADQIVPRQQDTQGHLELLEHSITWLELVCQNGELDDSDRLRIREFYCQIENFCDEIYDSLNDAYQGHDPAHGIDTRWLAELVEAYG